MMRAMAIAAAVVAGAWAADGGASAGKAGPAKSACCASACDTCCGLFCPLCCDGSCPDCCDACGTSPTAFTADEKPAAKEVKLTGTLVCGKCSLKEDKACTNVLQVKEGGKTVNYRIVDKGAGETYHEGVCGDGKVENVKVTGTVSEKDGKKMVKASKVELPKK